jgi:hypothetical protein
MGLAIYAARVNQAATGFALATRPPVPRNRQAPQTAANSGDVGAKQQFEARRQATASDEAMLKEISNPSPPLMRALIAFNRADMATEKHVLAGDYANALASMDELERTIQNAVARKQLEDQGANKEDIKKGKAAQLDGKVADIKKLADSPSSLDKRAQVWADPFLKNQDKSKVGDGDVTKEWKDLVSKILDVKVDDDFLARYDVKCDKASAALAGNKTIQDAYLNWSKWIRDGNQKEIEAAINEVLSVHSATLSEGHATPHKQPTVVFTKETKPGPEVFGSFNVTNSVMEIGEVARDFGLLIETLTHENTHAYQDKLVKEKMSGAIVPGDDDFPGLGRNVGPP